MSKNLIFILFSAAIFCAACTTIDIEKAARDSRAGAGIPEAVVAEIFPNTVVEVVVVEKPVFVPESEGPPPAPASGQQAVRESNREGIASPSGFSHAAVVYDYGRDWVYEVYAQPLRVTDISLEPGERAVELPFISDSERWIIGAGASYENGAPVQHIYVKPAEAGLEASLIINTDRRVYYIVLRSYRDVYMPIVRWRYLQAAPSNYLPSPLSSIPGSDNPSPGVDPRYLSFNYRITYGWFRKPSWLPELVFDDGAKTYITFPKTVLQRQLPAVFENRSDVLNFRVVENMIVIDKLVESITIKIDRIEITVAKKRG